MQILCRKLHGLRSNASREQQVLLRVCVKEQGEEPYPKAWIGRFDSVSQRQSGASPLPLPSLSVVPL